MGLKMVPMGWRKGWERGAGRAGERVEEYDVKGTILWIFARYTQMAERAMTRLAP
jgi:hypothetical protein